MEESKEKFLQNTIKSYFEKLSYGEKYNIDIVITILAVVFVIYVVLYVYFSSRVNLEKINWEKNKCNPFYMPFGKVINGAGDGFNGENLRNCLNNLTSNIASDILAPINAIVNIFSEILQFLAAMFLQILDYIMHLYDLLVSIFREIMLRLERMALANINIFAKVNNFIASLLGFIALIYYQIVIIVDSIKLIFPVMALSFLVGAILPSLLALVISALVLLALYVIAVTLSPVFCIGCWAWAPVAVWTIVVIFLHIFFILLITLYMIFAQACNDILVKIINPVSQSDYEMSFNKPPDS
tara:strand:- start:1017 stop:1910 length:894 start_codon:yes stop_codon:yes gene_type:complete